jgi:integrase
MPKFNLNLRDANAKGETPIHLVIRFDNQRIVIKTGFSVNPKQWNKTTQRLDISSNNPKKLLNQQINSHLTRRIADAEGIFINFETLNKRKPKAKELLNLLNESFEYKTAENKDNPGLFQFVENLINEMTTGVNPKTGKPYAVKTPVTYRRSLNLLRSYANEKKRRIDFDTIDLDFYLSYSDYLKKRGYKLNYIGKNIKTLKTFLNEALERKLTDNISHKQRRFTTPREQVSNIYLSIPELTALFNLDLSNDLRLDRVRDLFLFGCYTGLRFSDFSKVKPQNIDIEENLISIQTQKTGEMVTIPILPIAKAVLNKYNGKTSNSLPESISNQKFNKYLKEVTKRMPELNEVISETTYINEKQVIKSIPKWQKVTTHTARRSFATNMFKAGIPAQTIMKITGHRTESSFMTYLKLSNRESAQIILRDWQSKFAINQ